MQKYGLGAGVGLTRGALLSIVFHRSILTATDLMRNLTVNADEANADDDAKDNEALKEWQKTRLTQLSLLEVSLRVLLSPHKHRSKAPVDDSCRTLPAVSAVGIAGAVRESVCHL